MENPSSFLRLADLAQRLQREPRSLREQMLRDPAHQVFRFGFRDWRVRAD